MNLTTILFSIKLPKKLLKETTEKKTTKKLLQTKPKTTMSAYLGRH